jgi:hypothetical protein
VTVQNASTAQVISNVTVVEYYDARFRYLSANPAPASGTSNVWYIGDLPAGFVTNIVIVGRIMPDTLISNILFNTAEITSLSGSRTVHATTVVYEPASVGGRLWEDYDANFAYDGEISAHVVGQTVRLYTDAGIAVDSTLTDSGGQYSFTNLLPGLYYVQFSPPTNHAFVPPHAGTNELIDSDANPTNGCTPTFALAAGQNDRSWSAGVIEAGAIGDYVWFDVNRNGSHADEDLAIWGLNGATVALYRVQGAVTSYVGSAVTATTTGGNKGHYLFSGLPVGTYYVVIGGGIPKTFTVQTTPMQYTLAVNAATINTDADFGFNAPPTPVELLYFQALPDSAGVKLQWETAVELENLGYNIYRANSPEGIRTRVNAEMIAGVGSAASQTYELLDPAAEAGAVYYYWLEDVSWQLVSAWHGPVAIDLDGATGGSSESLGTFQIPQAGGTTAGVYRLRYTALRLAEIPVDTVDAALLQVWVDGRQVPAFVSAWFGPMQEDDFILFYLPAGLEGRRCEIRSGSDAQRISGVYAAPSDDPGSVQYSTADADQRLRFTMTPDYVRYLLMGFQPNEMVYIFDVTDGAAPKMLYGYAWIALAQKRPACI